MGNIRMDLAVGSRPGSFREPRSEQTSLSIRVLRCPAGAALQAGGRRFDPGWLHSREGPACFGEELTRIVAGLERRLGRGAPERCFSSISQLSTGGPGAPA